MGAVLILVRRSLMCLAVSLATFALVHFFAGISLFLMGADWYARG